MLILLLTACARADSTPPQAHFIAGPELIVPHSPERAFIGQGAIQLSNGDLLMAAPWGRPPTNFEQLAAKFPVPTLYRSRDGGRTWRVEGRMRMAWELTGMISDGGISFLRLQDGRLAFLSHRHVLGQHGGGLPVIAFSRDEGATWTPARLVGTPEGVWYVMNDRLIQLRRGRLVVPVARMAASSATEGDHDLSLCFFSDDGGETWQRSRVPADLSGARGMAEPAVVEVGAGRMLLLARTGIGCHAASWSDDGGDTWSKPERTTLTAACSPLTLRRLPDGRLIVFYNHAAPLHPGAFFPRTPLVYAVSADEGKSWSEPVTIDDSGQTGADRQCIYPSAVFTREGMVVLYSIHQADPHGSFKLAYDPSIGGGMRAILPYPK